MSKGWSNNTSQTAISEHTEDNNTWENDNIDENCVEECPEIEAFTTDKPKISFSEKSWEQIKSYCELIPNLEWCAAMRGKIDKNEYEVEELLFMEQLGSSAHIEMTTEGAKNIAKEKDIIGWIHSHNTMNAFFSSEDIANAIQYDSSVTVNNKLSFDARVTKKLTCGKKTLVQADVFYTPPKNDVKNEYKEEVEKKFKQRTYSTSSYASCSRYNDYGGGYGYIGTGYDEEDWEGFGSHNYDKKGLSRNQQNESDRFNIKTTTSDMNTTTNESFKKYENEWKSKTQKKTFSDNDEIKVGDNVSLIYRTDYPEFDYNYYSHVIQEMNIRGENDICKVVMVEKPSKMIKSAQIMQFKQWIEDEKVKVRELVDITICNPDGRKFTLFNINLRKA